MIKGETRVGAGSLWAYGFPALGLQATSLVASLYLLKFATEELLIAPGVVGSVLAASKVWDAVSDPLVGHASDHTRSRWGRRRPWMLAGAPLLALSFAALWVVPGDLASVYRIAWLSVAILGFYTAYTLVSVPHWSLGAALSFDGHQRNRVYAARGALQNAGLFVALIGVYFLENADASNISVGQIGGAIGAVSGFAVALGAILVREPTRSVAEPSADSQTSYTGSLTAFRDVASDRAARLVIGVVGLQEMATGALLVVLPFATEYIVEAPGQTAFYLIAFVVPMTASLPLWVMLGGKMDHIRAWRLGNGIEAIGFLSIIVAGAGDQIYLGLCAAIIGIGHGASRVFAMSRIARLADEGHARAGQSKTGLYFAAATFTEKCAVALAAFGVGLALQASGFEASQAPGADTLYILRGLTSVFPAALMVASCMLLTRDIENSSQKILGLAKEPMS